MLVTQLFHCKSLQLYCYNFIYLFSALYGGIFGFAFAMAALYFYTPVTLQQNKLKVLEKEELSSEAESGDCFSVNEASETLSCTRL